MTLANEKGGPISRLKVRVAGKGSVDPIHAPSLRGVPFPDDHLPYALRFGDKEVIA